MAAAVLEAPGEPLVVGEVELDAPGRGQVLVHIAHCGLCHSDLSVMTGAAPAPMPVILGHEASGVVAEVGPDVTTLVPGDHVMLTPIPPCGRCYWCLRGEQSLCVNGIGLVTQTLPDGTTKLRRGDQVVYQGLGVGGFAEFAVVLEAAAVKIPHDVPLELATVVGCAVQTGVGAVLNTAAVPAGATVLVMGLGGIGMAIVQGARLIGASRIIVSDPIAARRDLAERFGATDAVDPTSTDVVGACRDATAGIGVDYAFDAVGSSALARAGVDATRNGGTTVLVGAGPIDDPLELSRILLMVSEKKLTGCLLGSVQPHRDIPMLIELNRQGRLDLAGLVSATRPLAEINQAVADMEAGVGLRTILTP